jgi:acylphosphatase
VSGRVQGVFYRASAAEQAVKSGLVGFVRNEPDGSVLMEVEGEEEAIATFVSWARNGPPRARVDSCNVSQGDLKNYNDFKIQR